MRPLSRLLTTSRTFPKSGPFPPPELPGFSGITGLSATPHGPACPSRVAGCWLVPAPLGFPVLRESPVPTCLRPLPRQQECGAGVCLPLLGRRGVHQGHPVPKRSPFAWRVRCCDLHFRGLRATRILVAGRQESWTPNVHYCSGPLARRVPKGPSSPRASAKSLPPWTVEIATGLQHLVAGSNPDSKGGNDLAEALGVEGRHGDSASGRA